MGVALRFPNLTLEQAQHVHRVLGIPLDELLQ
jgi:hypothetical protein